MIEGRAASGGAEGGLGAERDDVRMQGRKKALGVERIRVRGRRLKTRHEAFVSCDVSNCIHVLLLRLDTEVQAISACAAAIDVTLQLIEEKKVQPRLVGKGIAVVKHEIACEALRERGRRDPHSEREEVWECAHEEVRII